MNLKSIFIILMIVYVFVLIIGMFLHRNKEKRWKFEPEKYRYIPKNGTKWNLNQMLYEMIDERVLVIFLVLYLFLVWIMECIVLASIGMKANETIYSVILFMFPVTSTVIGVGVFWWIKKANREKDYVQELLRNSLSYSCVSKDVLVWKLEEDIKNGLLFRTKKVNFSEHYIFISKSEVFFSPIAIPLNKIKEIRYKGHLKIMFIL